MPCVAIVVLSHGSLARSLVETAQMIAGQQEKLEWAGLEEGESPESFRERVQGLLTSFSEDEALFLIDLSGGTPSNVASMLFLERTRNGPGSGRPIAIVSGVNLGILLEALTSRQKMNVDELASHLVKVAPTTVVNLGQLLLTQTKKLSRRPDEGP